MIATTKHGFVFLLRGFEITYAHFPPAIGIAWTRTIVVGKRRWYLREDWTRFASSGPKGVRWYFRGR